MDRTIVPNVAEDSTLEADTTKTGVERVLLQVLPFLRFAVALESGVLGLALLNILILDGGGDSEVILQITIGLLLLFLIPSAILVYYTQTVIQND
jgi:hypothetical protein